MVRYAGQLIPECFVASAHTIRACILGKLETQLSFFPDLWEHCVFSGAFGFSGRQLTEEPWSLPNSLALKKSLTDAMQQVVDVVGGSSLHEISHSG